MVDDRGGRFVGLDGLRAGAGVEIERVEGIDFGAAFQITAGPIHGVGTA